MEAARIQEAGAHRHAGVSRQGAAIRWFSNGQKRGISSGSLPARGLDQSVLMDSDTRAFPHGESSMFSMENQSTLTK